MARFGRRRWSISFSVPLRHLKKYTGTFLLLFFFLVMVQIFNYVERNLQPALLNIANVQVEQIATEAINTAISQKIAMRSENVEDLVSLKYDQEGNIQSAVFNYTEYARIQGEAMAEAQRILHSLEDYVISIRLGQAFNSNILAHYGPNVPITVRPLGSAKVNLEFTMQTAGINTVMVTVYAIIQADVNIVIPFASDPSRVETRVPISNAVIVGRVPHFYYHSGEEMLEGNTRPPVNLVPPVRIE